MPLIIDCVQLDEFTNAEMLALVPADFEGTILYNITTKSFWGCDGVAFKELMFV